MMYLYHQHNLVFLIGSLYATYITFKLNKYSITKMIMLKVSTGVSVLKPSA